MSKPALEGIHVPSLTFFATSSKQEIDWDTQNKHLRFLIASGVHGIVLAGTNGEAITLSRTEKSELVRATREAARDLGVPNLPISLGTSGTSTRDVLDDCTAAKEAGADFALVLVPSFFHFAMTKDAICEFFEEVADASPVPVVIYNFPGVAAGLNVDSTMLDRLAKHEHIIARFYMKRGSWLAASHRLNFLIDEYPNFSGRDGAFFDLGETLTRLGRNGEARLYFERVINEFPESGYAEEARKRLSGMKA